MKPRFFSFSTAFAPSPSKICKQGGKLSSAWLSLHCTGLASAACNISIGADFGEWWQFLDLPSVGQLISEV